MYVFFLHIHYHTFWFNVFFIVVIKNLDIRKIPVSAVADNNEVRNIKSIRIKTNKSIKFTLLFDKNIRLNKKIKLEQLKKEIN